MLSTHNPGNIRPNPRFTWQGQIGSTPSNFIVFDTDVHGLRAIVKILMAYEARGLNTIRSMISTWAPPSDNNPTEAYISFVASQVGIKDTDPVKPEHYPKMLKAIVREENGSEPFSDEVIAEAIREATAG